ncbi:MAG TPA: hypothetical protein VGE93_13485, partial [Bryobacteraceae bacterium]
RLESMMERLAEELNSPRLQRGPSTGRKVRLGALGVVVEEVLSKEMNDESDDGAKDVRPRKGSRGRSRAKSHKVRTR